MHHPRPFAPWQKGFSPLRAPIPYGYWFANDSMHSNAILHMQLFTSGSRRCDAVKTWHSTLVPIRVYSSESRTVSHVLLRNKLLAGAQEPAVLEYQKQKTNAGSQAFRQQKRRLRSYPHDLEVMNFMSSASRTLRSLKLNRRIK